MFFVISELVFSATVFLLLAWSINAIAGFSPWPWQLRWKFSQVDLESGVIVNGKNRWGVYRDHNWYWLSNRERTPLWLEIKLNKLALSNTTNPDLIKFANSKL